MDKWNLTADKKPDNQHPVMGFSEDWVCEEVNPDGQRECFLVDDLSWVSAKWSDHQDEYVNDYSAPTHWAERLVSPAA